MASEDFGARLKSLITRFGFRPDEVSVSSRFGVGTISFKNQKGKATELVSKLRGAMKQMGVPEAAITAREVQYPADADGPAEHWGVVNVDFSKMPHSRPGAKATFKVEDRFYFGKGRKERFADDVTYSIAAHIGHEPVGHRSVRSLEEAKAIAKQMLASTKANAKGKPVLVEVYPVVNYSPKDAIVTLRG